MNETVSTKTRWWNKKRVLSAILALALVVALATGGTFAWNAISQSALNEAKADNIIPGGRLHDDFNGTNKDVYVENYGTLPIYVRVQLSEYMEIGDGAGSKGAWDPATSTYATDANNKSTPLVAGTSINDPSTWSKISTNDTQFGQYWDWTMGGQKTYMPTFNKDKTSLKTDITGLDAFGVTSDEYQHNVSDPMNGGTNVFGKDGSHNQYAVGDTVTDTATYKTGPVSETHTAQDTLPGSVITMMDWLASGSVPGPYWVVDTDGWAYWAQAIMPGTASGLLLNSISLNTEMDDNWYYGIYVTSDMATINDVSLLKDGTADGKNLIDVITGGGTIGVPSETQYANLGTTTQMSVTGFSDALVWSIPNAPAGVSINAATGVVSVATTVPVGTTFTVKATALNNHANSGLINCEVALPVTAQFFPDPTFMGLVESNYDADHDSIMTKAELDNVTVMRVFNSNIQDMTGLQYFTALTVLDCSSCQLGSLDVSKNAALTNLYCNNNQLTVLDISHNTALTYLNCSDNQIDTLNASSNTALQTLVCNNNQLTALDVSKNAALTNLYCNNNQLTVLDISHNTALTYLNCGDNQIDTLNASNNTALQTLVCNNNQIDTLDVSNNTALTTLYCYSNQITALDLSNNTALTYLSCGFNPMATLDLTHNTALTGLYCAQSQLTSLDLSNNTALTSLETGGNNIISIDISHNTALNWFSCKGNPLTTLDVSHNTALTYLDCSFTNQLSSLDLSQNTLLNTLFCGSNQLTALDVSHNTALTRLECSNNQITFLNVSMIPALANGGSGTLNYANNPGIVVTR